MIGRLLIRVTYVAVALLAIGVALLLAAGISPLAGGPELDLASIVVGLASLEPAAFLWLGLLAVIATPVTRVVAAGVGFARDGDRTMAAASVAILAVIVLAIVSSLMIRG
ncbi:MAG: DUF1634 domain-containing protein [Thermomicrobiales bacterium]|nr:DUF1634 domain-containing protein [Thermomicrobiales bacterium]